MPATSRSVVGMAHSYKKHYPATPALKENRIASKLAPTGQGRTEGHRRSGPCPRKDVARMACSYTRDFLCHLQ